MTDEHQIGYQALPRGVPVFTSDGVELGKVHRVQDNAREHIFDGLVVATKDGRVFVDAPEVARITTQRVTLTIDAAQARDLPAKPAGTAAHATRARGWRRWFSR
jgi:PRC-barrel domain protein